MIPSLCLATLALAAPRTPATDAPEPDAPATEQEPEDPLSEHRVSFDVLADRTIGTTTAPVKFDWRRSPAHIAAQGSFLLELNNFDSARGGALVRLPSDGLLFEVGVSYVGVWDTPSSRLLALTPYRQPGRPRRFELDLVAGLPLAEGVVTTFPRFFPAVEMVFSGYAGLRYLVYPTGFAQMKAGKIIEALFSPALTDTEILNLDSERRASMQVDKGRYGLMLGFGDDLYFKPGLFVSPRVLFAVPLLAPITETDLLFFTDLSLAIGVAL